MTNNSVTIKSSLVEAVRKKRVFSQKILRDGVPIGVVLENGTRFSGIIRRVYPMRLYIEVTTHYHEIVGKWAYVDVEELKTSGEGTTLVFQKDVFYQYYSMNSNETPQHFYKRKKVFVCAQNQALFPNAIPVQTGQLLLMKDKTAIVGTVTEELLNYIIVRQEGLYQLRESLYLTPQEFLLQECMVCEPFFTEDVKKDLSRN